jgi:protein-tyrosine-phosphatase
VSGQADPAGRPLRILFLCTRNAARSQMAEAVLTRKGRGRYTAASAGSDPASAVDPLALRVLQDQEIEWRGRPKGFDAVREEAWDFVITLCDRAREACPSFPGQPVFAHWGIPDPAEAQGGDERRYLAFEEALGYISRRIDLLLALPHGKMARAAVEHRLREIGDESLEAPSALPG